MTPGADQEERLLLRVDQGAGQMGVWVMDPTVTDAEREAAGLPTLHDTYAAVSEENRVRARAAAERSHLPDGVQIERVWRDPPADELERRLMGDGPTLWTSGGELTVAVRTRASFVYVLGGFELPLWRAEGSALWSATARVRDLNRTSLAVTVIESDEVGNAMADGYRTLGRVRWRGPELPPPPDRDEAQEHLDDVASTALGQSRRVRVAMPEGKPEAILFGTDGVTFAPIVRALERKGLVPPIALIGAGSAELSSGGSLARLDEYSFGRNEAKFEAHRSFFTRELAEWGEERYGVRVPRSRKIVSGQSAGGHFALDIPLLDPESFGASIALSPAGLVSVDPPKDWIPCLYGLGSGTLEDPGRTIGKTGELLRSFGAGVLAADWVGGHDPEAWEEATAALLPQLLH